METETFEQYVAQRCKPTTITAAKSYAAEGQALLEHFNSGGTEPPNKASKSTQMAYIHWYLLKEAFDSGKPFGKGMFNLQLKDEKATQALYNYLKGDVANEFTHSTSIPLNFIKSLFKPSNTNEGTSYSRDSSHYRTFLKHKSHGHLGIDKTDDVPLAWKFTTHAFGLNKDLSIYIKPEVASADLNKTLQAIKHGLAYIKYILGKRERLEGLNNYREEGLSEKVKEFAGDYLSLSANDKKQWNMINKCQSLAELKTVVSEIVHSDPIKYRYHDLKNFASTLEQLVMNKNQIGNEIRIIVAPEEQATNKLAPNETAIRQAYTELRRSMHNIRANEASSEHNPNPDAEHSHPLAKK